MEPLLEQISQWHEADQHQKIVDAILQLPQEERTYQITGYLARAYNNLARYEEGLALLESIADEGREDWVWWYRMGYSYFRLSRFAEAEEAFQMAVALNPEEGDCWYFLCRIYRDSIHKPEALAAALEQLKRVDPREFYRSFDNMKPISAPGGNKTHRQYPNGPENSRYEPLPRPGLGPEDHLEDW